MFSWGIKKDCKTNYAPLRIPLLFMNLSIIQNYENLVAQYSQTHAKLSKQHNIVTALRLLIMVAIGICIYYYFNTESKVFMIVPILLLAAFLVLMNISKKISWSKDYHKNLNRINTEEIAFLKREQIPFEDGLEFKDDTHAYTSDLDIFGYKSLFQNLNRTATHIGKSKLAQLFTGVLSNDKIVANQHAIAELSEALHWRQSLLAVARMSADSKSIYDKLIDWAQGARQNVSKIILGISYLFPAVLLGCLAIYFITRNEMYWEIAWRVFPINLFVMATQLKNIKQALFGADKINDILTQYAVIIEKIENADFKSKQFLDLQTRLQATKSNASAEIKKLSKICANMESIQNPFGAVLLNGLFLYHIHAWHRLNIWKKKYATHIKEWLDIIGEVEALNSLANLKYNNPNFCFPALNNSQHIAFEQLGHPLIADDKRVCNDIDFDKERFIILTGSNMSGKSTFLRTLGINMVLAGVGAPVCATKANIQPLKIFVSMRQSDSLADSESYFFAEVKRLKFIISQLQSEPCFILLDEILRGTNSDDKRSGTIGVIEKIIKHKTIGAIATHDLEVCLTTDLHPETLTNKCFEVEIINDELVFDYKLRNGICKNKSATFLMKKMEII